MGCTPGTTPEYLLLLQTHATQKPSISQGLYLILLLALLALTTSAYTSLSVSQDLNPLPQLLNALVYHSATSAVGCERVVEDLLGVLIIDLCTRSKDRHLGMHIEISEHALKRGNEVCEDMS